MVIPRRQPKIMPGKQIHIKKIDKALTTWILLFTLLVTNVPTGAMAAFRMDNKELITVGSQGTTHFEGENEIISLINACSTDYYFKQMCVEYPESAEKMKVMYMRTLQFLTDFFCKFRTDLGYNPSFYYGDLELSMREGTRASVACLMDHPIFYFCQSLSASYTGYCTMTTMKYSSFTPAETQKYAKKIFDFLHSYDGYADQYDTTDDLIWAVYEDICKKGSYAYVYKQLHDGTTKKYPTPRADVFAHSILGFATSGEAITNPARDKGDEYISYVQSSHQTGQVVCEGYAETLACVLNYLGCECVNMAGGAIADGVEYTDPDCFHAWNLIRFGDGQYYWADATWDDTDNKNYNARGIYAFKSYYGKGTDTFFKNHSNTMKYDFDKVGVYNACQLDYMETYMFPLSNEISDANYDFSVDFRIVNEDPVYKNASGATFYYVLSTQSPEPTRRPTATPTQTPTQKPTASPTITPSPTAEVPIPTPTSSPSLPPDDEATDEPLSSPSNTNHPENTTTAKPGEATETPTTVPTETAFVQSSSKPASTNETAVPPTNPDIITIVTETSQPWPLTSSGPKKIVSIIIYDQESNATDSPAPSPEPTGIHSPKPLHSESTATTPPPKPSGNSGTSSSGTSPTTAPEGSVVTDIIQIHDVPDTEDINPIEHQAKIKKLQKIKRHKKRYIKVTMQNITSDTHYELWYSTKAGWHTIKIRHFWGNKCILRQLKRKKTYRVKVRTIQYTENSAEYGPWSTMRKITIK